MFITKTFYDCSSSIREDWLPKLFIRVKLFIFELGDQNLDIGNALNALLLLCQNTLRHFNYHMSIYGSSFNSITINPILPSGVEIRYHFYYTISVGRTKSPLFDESLNSVLTSRLDRGLSADPNPHLQSSFLGSPNDDY